MATRDDIKKLIGFARLTWANYNPDDLAGVIDAWLLIVGHIPGDELQAAMIALAAQPGRAFAPAPGELIGQWMANRNRAAAVPSAAEAWNMIQEYQPRRRMVYCTEAQRLTRQIESDPAGYWGKVREYSSHIEHCRECGWKVDGVTIPAIVERVARFLGWPEKFPTPDNLDVCRAQFTKAYEAELSRQTTQAGEPPAVKKVVERLSTSDSIKALAERITVK